MRRRQYAHIILFFTGGSSEKAFELSLRKKYYLTELLLCQPDDFDRLRVFAKQKGSKT